MRKNDGVTLISLIIYIIVMLVIIATVGTITSIFNRNIRNMDEEADATGEYNKFSMYFLREIKQDGNRVEQIGKDGEYILFTSQNQFTFANEGIYFNNIKLCEDVKECKFSVEENDSTQVLKSYIRIGKNIEFSKQTEYVINITNEQIAQKVNAPILYYFNSDVTEYVTWYRDENNVYVEKTAKINEEQPTNWYNYDEKKWANIKTSGNNNVAYWVWIPRFAYRINNNYHTSTSESFDIKFLQGTTNIPYGENEEITNTTQGNGNWLVHPAFKLGETELEGIWVAKFSASSNQPTLENGGGNTTDLSVNILPNVTSWRNIDLSNMFVVCRNIETENGTLALSTSTTDIDEETALDSTAEVESFLMRNVDWGAVCTLSKSNYGKNDLVWTNPSSTFTTGQAGDAQDTINIAITNKYNTTNGINASSTGNVYGIYDMNSMSYEYVSAYLDNTYMATTGDNYTYNQRLILADDMFKDKYNLGSTNGYDNLLVDNKYGDCMYETSSSGSEQTSWNNGISVFPILDTTVIKRGGTASIFSFDCDTGAGNSTITFRPVIVCK